MVIFLYNLYIFVGIQHACLANAGFGFDPSNNVIKRLWCIFMMIIIIIIIIIFQMVNLWLLPSGRICFEENDCRDFNTTLCEQERSF